MLAETRDHEDDKLVGDQGGCITLVVMAKTLWYSSLSPLPTSSTELISP